MRLTQHTDYAIRVLIQAALQVDRRLTIEQVASCNRISRHHVVKIVQELKNLGLLKTTRGSGGGIELQRAPNTIVLGELVRAMEPDLGLVECFRPGNRCVITPGCVLPAILDEALRAFLEVLDRHTLADLLEREQRRILLRVLTGAGGP
ncbi:RrF2 family transcriptional regulator [Wenzhouxiangella marina]|uniref:Rrf2 family transcriptional regulator n=1 Tax=Wenzhouxiangella marina TaxID=1579979 RepID=A0A0K0XZ36_9GAMM|nr:Rrf2 family transcriptional regulator [Wenzhouxiangella marina]AKS42935.1 Rrf2 family transcriptional regulator [Wenzhouxiangella marina]MBB6087381.1 Rrf2 family nitric oxide-sensitive transcriptional repressor [Wenzhouxiangella marina]